MAKPLSAQVRAAEYVRMSTDGQQYSIANQQAAIRQYASEHGMEVIRTYADAGKSGLRLQGRNALIQLLSDVQRGHADFSAVLVYDVSRWGRFQDTDESGYYEYLCRRANIRVEYCVEQFQNDGGPLAAILKNIKRVMAAEYSREQSARVHRATCRVASLGYFTGGWPGYGLRRMLIGEDGKPRGVLGIHQYKAIRGERMILVPGPPNEVKTIHRIFRLFIKERLSPRAIADILNAEGKLNSHGRTWSSDNVSAALRNERYIGSLTYNVTSRKLKNGPRLLNDASDWVRTPRAFEPIISQEVFYRARELIAERRHKQHTEESLLARLRYLLNKHGYLSVALIKADAQPDMVVYHRKLGGVRKAYAKIGYKQPWDRVNVERERHVKETVKLVTEQLLDALRARGATVYRTWPDGAIVVNEHLTLAVKAMTFGAEKKRLGWRLYITRKKQPALTITVRMNTTNERPLDFFLLPRRLTHRCRMRLGARNKRRFNRYRYGTLDEVVRTVMTRAVQAQLLNPGTRRPSIDRLSVGWLTAEQLKDRLHDLLPGGLAFYVATRQAFVSALRGDDRRIRAAVPFDEQVRGPPDVEICNCHLVSLARSHASKNRPMLRTRHAVLSEYIREKRRPHVPLGTKKCSLTARPPTSAAGL
jgi:DNA invertase Pin-like site-specific DNA recombinase